MAPDPGAIRTVGCNLAKLVPDATVVADIQTAVDRAHSATVQACILLNVHIRRCLDANLPLVHVFDGNWIVKAFYEVTEGDGTPQRDPELIRSAELLPDIDRVSRRGMKQLLQANANVIATVAHNNVWMHFRKRLLDTSNVATRCERAVRRAEQRGTFTASHRPLSCRRRPLRAADKAA